MNKAYQSLERQEIEASIPNMKPRRRVKIPLQTPKGLVTINEASERNAVSSVKEATPTANRKSAKQTATVRHSLI